MKVETVRYKVIKGEILGTFQEDVNRMLRTGWELHGGLSVNNSTFYQAVKRVEYFHRMMVVNNWEVVEDQMLEEKQELWKELAQI